MAQNPGHHLKISPNPTSHKQQTLPTSFLSEWKSALSFYCKGALREMWMLVFSFECFPPKVFFFFLSFACIQWNSEFRITASVMIANSRMWNNNKWFHYSWDTNWINTIFFDTDTVNSFVQIVGFTASTEVQGGFWNLLTSFSNPQICVHAAQVHINKMERTKY